MPPKDNVKKPEEGAPAHGPGMRGAAAGRIRIEKDSFQILKRILSFIQGKGKLMLAVGLVGQVLTALISVRATLFVKSLIDVYIEPMLLQDVPDFAPLLGALTKLAVLYGIAALANLFVNLAWARVAQGALKNIRDLQFAKMQDLPVGYFDSNSFGNIMSHFTNDTDSMRQMISQSLPQVVSSMLSIVATGSSMIALSWQLSLMVLVTMVVIYFITMTVGSQSAKYFKIRQKSIGLMNGCVEETLNGLKVVKVFCHEEKSNAEFAERNEEVTRNSRLANSFASILGPINNNLSHLQYALLALIGGTLAVNGKAGLTLGTIASFLMLTRSFSQPIGQISQQINSVVMALAGARRVFALMDEAPESDEGKVTLVNVETGEDGTLRESAQRTHMWAWKRPLEDGSFEYVKLAGDVRFKDVDFSYVEGKEVLHDINMYAKPGQKIALVGSTGAGKTTITNLLTRFYDISDGSITYDGISVKDIKKSDLRKSLGMVLQDVNLFSGTIMDNIRYGRLDATDEEVIAAARLANADDFIEKLPEGYNTFISGSGSQLSQGQCQLLAIARCAVADPPAMILDEATSSIDTRTERLIQEGMDSLMKDRTVFVIAHRLSTIRNANAIMVLENGRIIERGSHDELIAQKGRYYQLYTGKTAAAAD